MSVTMADVREAKALGWNPLDWITPAAPKSNFAWREIRAAGFTDAQINAYLKGTGLTRWAAERNIGREGMLMRMKMYVESKTTTPTGEVKTRVSEETPEEVFQREFKKGMSSDLKKLLKYAKYGAIGIVGLVLLLKLKG